MKATGAQAGSAAHGAGDLERGDDGTLVRCSGAWTLQHGSALERRLRAFSWPDGGAVTIDARAVTAMDTSGAWLFLRIMRALESEHRTVHVEGLREEFRKLIDILAETGATAGPGKKGERGVLAAIGHATLEAAHNAAGIMAFLGESTVCLARALARPSRIRWRPVLYNLQTGGLAAMPITGLLSFLLGIVITYQGAGQLERYGASIFVADLVGLSMLRELSPLLTAIIIAGRSGSAYAAQIGTMKVTEEIDALRTIGIAPMDLLVLPKMIALTIALPLLTIYTDIMGIFGGMIMARAQLGVGFEAFLDRLQVAVDLPSFLIGVGKAPVFALIIAVVGCYQGFQASGSADSVGRQTTVSVVESIFIVIIADALFSIAFSWAGI